MIWELTKIELRKIALKPRSYLGIIALLVITSLIQLAMYVDGEEYINLITQTFEASFVIEGKILNGSLICFIILQMLIIQMPLLVSLVGGDLISGEAASGTLRLILTRPASRIEILLSKYFAGLVYTFILLVLLGIMSLGLGMALHGLGDLVVLKADGIVILQSNDVLWRFFGAFGLAFISLSLVTTLNLMLSCFTNNSIGPIIGTMSIIFIFTLIGALEVSLFDYVRPFLFTTHMLAWKDIFEDPISPTKILTSVSINLLHIGIFLFVSIRHFISKDIQS